MQVKVCGITSTHQAIEIADLGVDYLGFIVNFPDSPRSLAFADFQRICTELDEVVPDVKKVGVFVDQEVAFVKEVALACNLSVVQLHGSESFSYCDQVDFVETWKAVELKSTDNLDQIKLYAPHVDRILLDSGRGSGKVLSSKLLSILEVDILAGGIGPDNITEMIDKYHPQIIDLNSKVEVAPGIKDLDLIRECLKKIS